MWGIILKQRGKLRVHSNFLYEDSNQESQRSTLSIPIHHCTFISRSIFLESLRVVCMARLSRRPHPPSREHLTDKSPFAEHSALTKTAQTRLLVGYPRMEACGWSGRLLMRVRARLMRDKE